MRKLLIFVVTIVLASSCGNKTSNAVSDTDSLTSDTIIIDMAENGEETVATVKHHEEKVLEEAPIA